jgi:Flp pilus assembly pilin Flp
MKAFLLACVSAVVIAVISVAALNTVQQPVDQAFTTSGVRL